MVGQHDAAAADADGAGGACYVADEHCRGRTGKTRNGMMLREPKTFVAQLLNMAREVD